MKIHKYNKDSRFKTKTGKTKNEINKKILTKITRAKNLDKLYDKAQFKEITEIIETDIILDKIFGKDVTSLIIPYIFVNCQNCRKLLKNYKTCNRCDLDFCLECYYDIDFGCAGQGEHFVWH